jgi:hypothetical protein
MVMLCKGTIYLYSPQFLLYLPSSAFPNSLTDAVWLKLCRKHIAGISPVDTLRLPPDAIHRTSEAQKGRIPMLEYPAC